MQLEEAADYPCQSGFGIFTLEWQLRRINLTDGSKKGNTTNEQGEYEKDIVGIGNCGVRNFEFKCTNKDLHKQCWG